MPLTPSLHERISRVSRLLWEDFARFHGGEYSPHNIFKHEPTFSHTVNESLLEFFRYCSQILIREDVYETEIWWDDLSEIRDEGDDNRAVSWLACQQLAGNRIRLIIVLDQDCLLREVPVQLLQSVRAKLILHEVGHIFHFDQLFDTSHGYAKEATPAQEAEAWWFCYAVLGLAVAHSACEKKQDPSGSGLPPIWRLIQMRP